VKELRKLMCAGSSARSAARNLSNLMMFPTSTQSRCSTRVRLSELLFPFARLALKRLGGQKAVGSLVGARACDSLRGHLQGFAQHSFVDLSVRCKLKIEMLQDSRLFLCRNLHLVSSQPSIDALGNRET